MVCLEANGPPLASVKPRFDPSWLLVPIFCWQVEWGGVKEEPPKLLLPPHFCRTRTQKGGPFQRWVDDSGIICTTSDPQFQAWVASMEDSQEHFMCQPIKDSGTKLSSKRSGTPQHGHGTELKSPTIFSAHLEGIRQPNWLRRKFLEPNPWCAPYPIAPFCHQLSYR